MIVAIEMLTAWREKTFVKNYVKVTILMNLIARRENKIVKLFNSLDGTVWKNEQFILTEKNFVKSTN